MMASVAPCVSLAANPSSEDAEAANRLIDEEKVWVYDCFQWDRYRTSYFRFNGTREIDGKEWHILESTGGKRWVFKNCSADNLSDLATVTVSDAVEEVALMREENGVVYRLIEESSDDRTPVEVVLYDFNAGVGDSYNAWHPSLPHDFFKTDGICFDSMNRVSSIEIINVGNGSVNAYSCDWLYKESNGTAKCEKDKFQYADGIGNIGMGLLHALNYDVAVGGDYGFQRFEDNSGKTLYSKRPFYYVITHDYVPMINTERTWIYRCGENGGDLLRYIRMEKTGEGTADLILVGEKQLNGENDIDYTDYVKAGEPKRLYSIREDNDARAVYLVNADEKESLLYDFMTDVDFPMPAMINGDPVDRRSAFDNGILIRKVEWVELEDYRCLPEFVATVDNEEVRLIESIGNTGRGGFSGIWTKSGMEASTAGESLYNTALERVVDDNGEVVWQAPKQDPGSVEDVPSANAESVTIQLSAKLLTARATDSNAAVDLALYDVSGRKIASVSGQAEVSLSTERIPSGAYVARASEGTGFVTTMRVMLK